MNYEDMSDFEVNKWIWRLTMNGKTMHCHGTTIYKESTRYNEFDPCNNPSDAWPIIVENKIGVVHNWNEEGMWTAIAPISGVSCDCNGRKPLRAAMICFLKMKDAENGR